MCFRYVCYLFLIILLLFIIISLLFIIISLLFIILALLFIVPLLLLCLVLLLFDYLLLIDKKKDRGFVVPGPLVFSYSILELKLPSVTHCSFPIQECGLSTLR